MEFLFIIPEGKRNLCIPGGFGLSFRGACELPLFFFLGCDHFKIWTETNPDYYRGGCDTIIIMQPHQSPVAFFQSNYWDFVVTLFGRVRRIS